MGAIFGFREHKTHTMKALQILFLIIAMPFLILFVLVTALFTTRFNYENSWIHIEITKSVEIEKEGD
jgi:flagellar biogenesis protein FliO